MDEKILQIAIKAAHKAGEYVLSKVNNVRDISHKRGINDLVTEADRNSEDIIIEEIRNNFPDHSILAEESGEKGEEGIYKWVIDPIDGTTNFAHGLPIFCISIGVQQAGRTVGAVVFDPNREETFNAVAGEGAFLNGSRIRVSQASTLETSLISTGFAYDYKKKTANLDKFKIMLGKAQAVRRPGSAALDLCYVACGRFDGYWEQFLAPWDTAAGYLIVQEAGGRVSRFDGSEYNIFDKEILASNGHIHEAMMEVTRK
jgi:myo-inositol-1(or 4)-monophosphatase